MMGEYPPLEIRKGRSLPHWTREGCPNYVTMRLGDALPENVVDSYREDLRTRLLDLEQQLKAAVDGKGAGRG